MRSRKMIYWALSVPAVILLLIFIIVKLDTSGHDISRAMASKAMALALTGREECAAMQKQSGSRFEAGEQENWYAKYIDYLAAEGYLEWEEGVSFDEDYAMEPLTYGEAAYAAEQVSKGLSQALNISKKKYEKPIPKDEWWLFYQSFVKAADSDGAVREEKILLYGTPKNVKEAAAWTAYTSGGTLGFEGLSLDAYIDHQIRVLVRGSELIHLEEDVTDQVEYRNVWCVPDKTKVSLYLGTIVREFGIQEDMTDGTEGVLADVTLENGRIRKLSLKRDTIEGKVLAVRDDTIEIEGYGTLKLDADFRVYKTYGVVKEQKKKDILVGYDPGRFVVAGKKVCAALLTKGFSAKSIRVLVMNDDFSSLFHETVALHSDSPLEVSWGSHGEHTETVEAGTELSFTSDDERLTEGRIRIEPTDPGMQITVSSVARSQGTPSYYGSFEVSREAEGLLLLNEVDVEDYLTQVVPSEMPVSYELEALKAQAVCARTYAYRQIQANAYSRYGAHVDDSTKCQVYNNTASGEKADLAVKETDGEMIFYGEEPVEAYYFSTSCGYSTDGTIWGAAAEDVPYLKGKLLTQSGEDSGRDAAAMTDNDAFTAFIRGDGAGCFDSGFAMYRWQTSFTDQQLAERISGIGQIQGIFVTSRGTGGIAKTVTVVGSQGEKTLTGQNEIRNVLGSADLTYTRKDGTTLTGTDSLPSAFFAVDETARDENGVRTFTIWGGGYGHGVGLSQNGAQGMAQEGKGYREILEFFYDGVQVRELE